MRAARGLRETRAARSGGDLRARAHRRRVGGGRAGRGTATGGVLAVVADEAVADLLGGTGADVLLVTLSQVEGWTKRL